MKTVAIPVVLLALVVFSTPAHGGDHRLIYRLDGSATKEWYGRSVAGAGDVNKDGFDDVIVGTHWGGYVTVYSGNTGKTLYTLQGDSSADFFGREVSGAGDVNRDGYADFIVGTDTGEYARVFSGKDGKALYTFSGDASGDNFGYSVRAAGDVNADGYDDLIVGTVWGNYARVFSGKTGKTLYTFRGDSSSDQFGRSVSGAGDMNRDGYDDVLVASYGSYVRAFSGKDGALLHTFTFPSVRGSIGRVSGTGDVNGDGYDDVVVGWPVNTNSQTNPSVACVYSGKDGTTLYTLSSGMTQDWFGCRVGKAGDLNGDGYDDIIVGAAKSDMTGTNSGSAYVFSGLDGTELYRFDGEASADSFGVWVNGAGDVNGDGRDDVIVGATYADHNGTDSGSVYVFASASPTGSLRINDGRVATNSTSVRLDMSWQATKAWVEDMRFRNEGGAWGNWRTVAARSSWDLPPGEGPKVVEAQLRDADGLTSRILSASIYLDQTSPVGTVLINGGAPITTVPWVELYLEYTDLQSGVTEVRFRNDDSAWGPWTYVDSTKPWTITALNGRRTVEAQFRDAAGNESPVCADSIVYISDLQPPRITTVHVCDNRPYVCPDEEFRILVHALDNSGGSGLDSFRWKLGQGGDWSDWASYSAGPSVTIQRPEIVGPVCVFAVARDRMGNTSEALQSSTYLLKMNPSWLGAGGKGAGTFLTIGDVDAFTLGLVSGDTLDVKVASEAANRKEELVLDLDVVSPSGERYLTGGYPADAEEPGITGWAVPETGRYLLVLRAGRKTTAESGRYALKVKVRQAKANKKAKGGFSGMEIPFDAVEGSKFKASFKGEGIEPAGVTLIGPDGPVPIEVTGKPGKVKIKGVVLSAGTGTYTIRFAGPVTVSAKWSVKLPKIKGTVRE